MMTLTQKFKNIIRPFLYLGLAISVANIYLHKPFAKKVANLSASLSVVQDGAVAAPSLKEITDNLQVEYIPTPKPTEKLSAKIKKQVRELVATFPQSPYFESSTNSLFRVTPMAPIAKATSKPKEETFTLKETKVILQNWSKRERTKTNLLHDLARRVKVLEAPTSKPTSKPSRK